MKTSASFFLSMSSTQHSSLPVDSWQKEGLQQEITTVLEVENSY